VNNFQSWYRVQPRAIRALLTINVVAYLLWAILLRHIGPVHDFVWQFLALNATVPQIFFYPWQLITYNFLHLGEGFWGFIHLLFNMLWLFWIGKEYEELDGSHRLLAAYLIGGIGGGFLTVLFYSIFPGAALVYGASASVLGVMMAVAITHPYRSIALLFIGTVRLIWVVVGFLVLDFLFIGATRTAVTAHLGGALFGLMFAKAERNGYDLSSWTLFLLGDKKRKSHMRSVKPKKSDGFFERIGSWLGGQEPEEVQNTPSTPRSTRATEPRSPEPSPSADIDRILDKISERGYDSLSEEEKRILYEASKK
jgi:membrane associated rhomboid family serine protease